MDRLRAGLSGASDLLSRYADLEETLGDGDGGNFISGWQCVNPWKEPISRAIDDWRAGLRDWEYLYADRVPAIEDAFRSFHQQKDKITPERIIFGSGSTCLLLLLASWFGLREIRQVYYLAPMYFTLHTAFKILGIRTRPINAKHPFEPEFSLNLPRERSVLVVTDPIWYAGTRVPPAFLTRIAKWQLKTGSEVLVDGSFQYMPWALSEPEATNRLESSLTYRVICPTKQLVMHGYRASYALVPTSSYRQLQTLHSHLFGSLSVDTMAFLLAAPALLGDHYGHNLMRLARARHSRLRDSGHISAAWEPTCGYFCFERVTDLPPGMLLMDGSYFQQPRYPDHCRVNLLSPQLGLLGPDVDIGVGIEFDDPSA